MKDTMKTNIKVGITVLIAIFILLYILGWAKRITIAGDYNVIKMRFNSVSGLEIGDHITVNGVKQGKVSDIILDGNSVIVKGLIPKKIVLKKDAVARLEMMDLMGGKKIEINPGNSDEFFDINQLLEGKIATDIPGALSMVGNVEQDLKIIILDTRNLLEKINRSFTDEDMITSLRASIKNLENFSNQLNKLLIEHDKEISSTLKNLNNITSKTDSLLVNNADSLFETINSTKQLISNLNSLIVKIDTLLYQTTSGENNLGKALYDKELYNNLNQSIDKLDKITTILLKQLEEKGIKVDAKLRLF